MILILIHRFLSLPLTPDGEDDLFDGVGVLPVLDDVHTLVLLLHVLQHQVAQRVQVSPGGHHLAVLHQHHLGRLVGLGFKHNLSSVSGRDVEVDVLPEEGLPALFFD